MRSGGQLDMEGEKKLENFYAQPELWALERYESNADQRLRARVIASLLDSEVESVLDVGCANGFITSHLRAGKIVVGMDPSSQALINFKGCSVVARGESIPFGDGSFGAVICTEVLEHLESDVLAKVTAELRRVARDILVIGVPYREDLRLSMIRCEQCGRHYHADLHCRLFHGPEDVEVLFPDFKGEAVILLNNRVEIKSKLYRWAKYSFLGADDVSEFAMCPYCGVRQIQERNKQRKKSLGRCFFEGLDWRMPRRTVSHWMILLLRRR